MTITEMTKNHWNDVSRIYAEGIKTGNATFEQECPGWSTWGKSHREDCRSVSVNNGMVTGWAALSNISERCVYDGVCEVSIYVDPEYQGQGVGQLLMENLIRESESSGIWTLQAGIFPENESSITLHKKNGFRVIGYREKLGKMNDRWRDVVLLERRSKTVGSD